MGSEFPDDKMEGFTEGFTVKQRALDRPRKSILDVLVADGAERLRALVAHNVQLGGVAQPHGQRSRRLPKDEIPGGD